jgi:hypothetical protein
MAPMSFISKLKTGFRFPKKGKSTIYVACSIEHANTVEWRDWFKQELDSKYHVILPDMTECPYDKSNSQYPKWIFDNFVEPDIEDVAACDEFFLFIDPTFNKSAGAKAEVTVAAMLDKRITYLLHGIKLEDLNSWVIGCLYNAHMVPDMKAAVQHYKLNGKDNT